MVENSIQQTTFDYTGVDEAQRALVVGYAAELKVRLRKSVEDIIEIGRLLSEARSVLKQEQQFEAWLDCELGMKTRSAHNFMNVYSKSAKFADLGRNLANFVPSALYLLTAPKVSKAALNTAVKRAQKGERITVEVAREIVGKPPKKQVEAAFNMVAGNAVRVEREAEPVKRTAKDVPYKAGEVVLHIPTGLRCQVVSITPDGCVKLKPTVSTLLTRSFDWSRAVVLEDIAMGKAGVASHPVVVEKPTPDNREMLRRAVEALPDLLVTDVLQYVEMRMNTERAG